MGSRMISRWFAVLSNPFFSDEITPGGGEICSVFKKFITC
jgi:hypothetical protein